ncbi:SGNH/GDSL hydrolase family protein [Salinibacterium sp. NK8237]|uniref:SGNH/GDSL hydrolase family protein n=1 Tax=Salinibacterium sp. NK8237 TaxID=2792038 RepID=UPI001E379D5C|nr:SGNH/GDSL hydrolase family protein [Salinibacterium sp. NK8237]
MSSVSTDELSTTMCRVDPKNTPPKRATGVPPEGRLAKRASGRLIRLFRPLLKVSWLAYRAEIAGSLFPSDAPEGAVDGPNAYRMLFIGDTAASGLGVLNHGLAVVSQTARFVAREHSAGCSWTTMTNTELTMARAARQLAETPVEVDAVIVVLGIPDVLQGTSATTWRNELVALTTAARRNIRPDCLIVVGAVPPMHHFRPLPRTVKRILCLQISRLNDASLSVVESIPGMVYSPFPRVAPGSPFIRESRNWKSAHSLWGKTLGASTALALRAQRHPESSGPSDHN